MTKALVSARRKASSPDRYAWVWVSPLRDGTFKVSAVEIPRRLVDENICFFEDDIDRVHVGTVLKIADIDELMESLGVDPDELDAPWHNDFPL
ncbi:hypothetical protein [Actinomadura rudentiformis]|uniref:Uncharacterized protein n=1 Tax=Actinomadura rudentiformis TaxID=359158 RepID=A0A6H9Y927_9ACTN|nr:hypothetical protein [Actinomadura rudentiformis]KAB2339093.1 hypothetical protein F8566_49065 [Actinomadura rudentiformis]